MDVVIIHGNGSEWEETTEEIICGTTTCRRYANIKSIVDCLTSPGSVYDYAFLNILLLCLPSISSPIEFFNCLLDKFTNIKIESYNYNKHVVEQIQMKILITMRCWVINPWCAYADMSSGSLLDNMIELMRDINKKYSNNGESTSIVSLARKIKVCITTIHYIYINIIDVTMDALQLTIQLPCY